LIDETQEKKMKGKNQIVATRSWDKIKTSPSTNQQTSFRIREKKPTPTKDHDWWENVRNCPF